MTTTSTLAEGLFVDYDGRYQVTAIRPGRAYLRRAGNGQRRSMALVPGVPILLAPNQGTCAACGLPLVPGDDEDAAHPRSTGPRWPGDTSRLRYFCPDSDDALHHARREPAI